MTDLFDEYLSQPRLPKGVVLQVEPVKSVEGVFVHVHVQGVHVQFVPVCQDQVQDLSLLRRIDCSEDRLEVLS